MDWIELGRALQPWATIFGVSVTAFSLALAAWTLRMNSKTNKAKFVSEVTDSFLKDQSVKEFWYKLDYEKQDSLAWKFEISKIRGSSDEITIDSIIYKFGVVGHMLKTKAIDVDNISALYILCRQVFRNEEIRNYIRYVQLDFFISDGLTHLQFEEALYCYKQMTKRATQKRRAVPNELASCTAFISELKRLPSSRDLQNEVASRIGYVIN